MTSWNATMATGHPHTEQAADEVIDALIDFHPATSTSPAGAMNVTITLEAESLAAATRIALTLLPQARAITVLSTADFDAAAEQIPELLSVAQAAAQLGTTTQNIRDRLARGTLPGRRIGRDWVLPTTLPTN